MLLAMLAVAACSPTRPDGTGFVTKTVSPTTGSVIALAPPSTIVITGSLSVEEGFYNTFVFVRDDGVTFMSGVWGPAAQLDSWDAYPFKQSADYHFGGFCRGHTVERAVFIASKTNILQRAGANEPNALYAFRDFPWGIVEYSVDIPLNYTCR
jgi:hypothetical protein